MPSPAGTTGSAASTLGYGTSLNYSQNNGSTYTQLGQVEDISQPEIAVTKVDKTWLLSPNRTREKRPGLIDSGEVKIKCIFAAAVKTLIYSMIASGETDYWKIIYPDGTTTSSNEVFQAFVSGYGGEVPLDNNIMADITLTITGPVTFTAGS